MEAYNNHDDFVKGVPYVYSNWCSYDSLDGNPFKHDERIRITWEDDSKSDHDLEIKQFTQQIQDMGSPYDVPHLEAYAVTEFKGNKFIARVGELKGVKKVERLHHVQLIRPKEEKL